MGYWVRVNWFGKSLNVSGVPLCVHTPAAERERQIHRNEQTGMKGNEYDINLNNNRHTNCIEIGTMQMLDRLRERWKKTQEAMTHQSVIGAIHAKSCLTLGYEMPS